MQSMDNRVESNAEVMGAQYFRLTMTGDEVVLEPVVLGFAEYWDSMFQEVPERVPHVSVLPVTSPDVIDEVVIEIKPTIEPEPITFIVESILVVEVVDNVRPPVISVQPDQPIKIIDSTPIEEVQPSIQVVLEPEPDPIPTPVLSPVPAPWYSRLWTILNTDILVLAKRAYSWWVNL